MTYLSPTKGAAAMVNSGSPATDFLGWGAERNRRPLHSSTSLSCQNKGPPRVESDPKGHRLLLCGERQP
jgi:hypothetical protein